MVPLNQERIEKNEPLVVRIGPAACVYSIEGDTITIACARENVSLIGEYGKASQTVSIVLDGLPASKARDYRLSRRSIRGRLRSGPQHARFASLSGILALWMQPDGRLRGRLRALAKQQHFHVLTGWTGEGRVALVGEFTAVRDPKQAEAVRLQSEADGMEREPAPRDPENSRTKLLRPTARRSQ